MLEHPLQLTLGGCLTMVLAVVFAYLAAFFPAVALSLEGINKHLLMIKLEKGRGHLFYGLLLLFLAALFAWFFFFILIKVLAWQEAVSLAVASTCLTYGLYMFRKRKAAKRTRSYRVMTWVLIVSGSLLLYITFWA